LGESDYLRGHGGRDEFIDSWLDTVSTTGEPRQVEMENESETIASITTQEANEHVVAASRDETEHFAVATRDNTEFRDQIFTFGKFQDNLVINVSIPKSIWANLDYLKEPQQKDECTLQRYMAVTADPGNFVKAGFRLRQQILGREIERLVAVIISEDLNSYEVAEKISKVVNSVRSLISNSGDRDSWTQIVVGFFCDLKLSSMKILYPQHYWENVLSSMGVIAEWPVRVEMPKKTGSFICGTRYPAYMNVTSDIGGKKKIQAHIHEVSTFLIGIVVSQRLGSNKSSSLLH
jgi:hypothetical protein